MVDEETYAQLVEKRKNDNFVEADDGEDLGYANAEEDDWGAATNR
jgi:hypothetical protein